MNVGHFWLHTPPPPVLFPVLYLHHKSFKDFRHHFPDFSIEVLLQLLLYDILYILLYKIFMHFSVKFRKSRKTETPQ